MQRLTLLLTTILVSSTILGQKTIGELKNVDADDLHMKSCAFEPDANAVKLFDVHQTSYDEFTFSMQLKTERKVRIKIFNEKGYEHGTIRIPYFSKKGVAKIRELKGAVYNLGKDGKVTVQKLEKKDFFKEKAIENVGILSFTFPNMQPGCIIEYSYTTIENNMMYLMPWIIQEKIPVAYSSKIIITPVEAKVFDRPFGIDSIPQTYDLLKQDRYRRTFYFKENILSFKEEPYMSSVTDHLIRVSFLLFPRGASYYAASRRNPEQMWKAAGLQLLKSTYFKEQVEKTIVGTEKLIDSAKAIKSIPERIGFIYREVKKKFPGKVEQTINAENLTEAWNERSANSAEINLILLNLLLKADVNSLPLLVSTRDNGKINKEFPSFGQMNGIDVVAIDSVKFYVLDASIKYQSYQNPPLNILNREAIVLSTDSTQWVTIADNKALMKQVSFIVADIKDDGNMEGTANIQYFDYAKSYKLDTLLQEELKEDDKFFDKKPVGLKIISSERTLSEDESDPLYETIEFQYEPQVSDDFIFINPQLFTERNKNPFIAEIRNTDLDLGCNQQLVQTMQINLPSTYVIEHLPKNITLRAPDSSFIYKVIYAGDAQRIQISQSIEVNRAVFGKEEYAGIKDFYKQMYTLMSEEIILKKKK